MDLLTNPNVAYLLLLAFIWLALLSVIAPGSGILEVVALFALALAGIGVYNNPFNWWAFAVLVFVALPLMAMVFKTGRLIYLGLAILALIISSAYLFPGDGWLPGVDPVLALLASIASGLYFWLVVQKALEVRLLRAPHDLPGLVGSIGEVRLPIVHGDGTVYAAGELWRARSTHEIAGGERVRIVERNGLTLQVEPVESDQHTAV